VVVQHATHAHPSQLKLRLCCSIGAVDFFPEPGEGVGSGWEASFRLATVCMHKHLVAGVWCSRACVVQHCSAWHPQRCMVQRGWLCGWFSCLYHWCFWPSMSCQGFGVMVHGWCVSPWWGFGL
jgi:hypothetical protein